MGRVGNLLPTQLVGGKMYKKIVTILFLISLIVNVCFAIYLSADYINMRKLANKTVEQYIKPHELETLEIMDISKSVTWYVIYRRPLITHARGPDHFTIVITDGSARFIPGI